MQASRFSFMARNDVLLGVCAALGEDFGFNPLYLRATLGVLLLWNPQVILGAYALGFVLVLASRILFPSLRKVAEVEESPIAELPLFRNDDTVELAKAA